MADAAAGATGKFAMGLFGPHPSITIVTFWQGIVEIVLRGVSVILAFIAIITAAVALGNLDKNYGELDDGLEDLQPDDDWTWEQTANLSKSASGFLIFVSVFAIVIEGLIIAQRFLNFGIVDHFITICLIADIIISGVFAFLYFCIAVSTAVYAGRFMNMEDAISSRNRRFINNFAEGTLDSADDLNENMGSVSAFSFFTLITFVGLAVFMGVSLLLRWRNSQAKYATGGKDSGAV